MVIKKVDPKIHGTVSLSISIHYQMSRKRTLSLDSEDSETNVITGKRQRYLVADEDNRMIYSIGSEIHFTAPVSEESIETLIKKFSQVISDQTKRYRGEEEKIQITYVVDSPGGEIPAVLKFVDYMRMVKEKHTNVEFVSVITGLVASAGTIMCIVADKRMMTKNAYAMVHELSAGPGHGIKYTYIKSHADFVTKLHNTLVDIYMDKLKDRMTRDQLELLLKDESWCTAEQYKDYGFVDHVT